MSLFANPEAWLGLLTLTVLEIVLGIDNIIFISILTGPWFHVLGHPLSGRDLILIAGGLFLLFKSTREIHEGLEGDAGHAGTSVRASFASVVGQIMLLDIVF